MITLYQNSSEKTRTEEEHTGRVPQSYECSCQEWQRHGSLGCLRQWSCEAWPRSTRMVGSRLLLAKTVALCCLYTVEDQQQLLSSEEIRKELTGSVAIAVQKGNAKILLAEYHRAVSGAARYAKE